MNKIILALCALLFSFAATQAEARGVEQQNCVWTQTVMTILPACSANPFEGVRSIRVRMHRERTASYTPERAPSYSRARHYRIRHDTPVARIVQPVVSVVERVASAVTQYLPHPAGCPRSAFCGCGAAQEVGKSGDRSLWLAASWYKFPRSAPASGTVAVRPHHVFVLKQHVGGDKWLVADYNSGGRMSRLHVRSINGYTIVNPS